MSVVLLLIGSVWAALFLFAAREEIADAWRTHHFRAAVRSLNSRKGHR